MSLNGVWFSEILPRQETPSGTLNGTNRVFTLANVPLPNSQHVLINGVIQVPGTDYTIAFAVITFTVAPTTNDVLWVTYLG